MTLINWVFEKCARAVESGCSILGSRIREKQTIYTEGRPYLTRHYVRRHRNGDGASEDEQNARFGLFLHFFHRGDEDAALHNHPFKWSYSLILTNGYREERWDPKTQKVVWRTLRPGSINRILANDFHRVELIDPNRGAWTLFLTGPRVNDWGFWWPGVHGFVPWKQFTRSRNAHERPS